MSLKEMMSAFDRAWIQAGDAAAIARGVPAWMVYLKGWDLSNLCPTAAGMFAFVSYGDGKTVLAEFTEMDLRKALKFVAPQHPGHDRQVFKHRDHHFNHEDFAGEIGNMIFTASCMNFQGVALEISWWRLEEWSGGGKCRTCAETAHVRFHMDGTAGFCGYFGDGSQMPDAPKAGQKPLTEALFAELGIPLLFEWRPMTAADIYAAHKHAFLGAHAPSVERQTELQTELASFLR